MKESLGDMENRINSTYPLYEFHNEKLIQFKMGHIQSLMINEKHETLHVGSMTYSR